MPPDGQVKRAFWRFQFAWCRFPCFLRYDLNQFPGLREQGIGLGIQLLPDSVVGLLDCTFFGLGIVPPTLELTTSAPIRMNSGTKPSRSQKWCFLSALSLFMIVTRRRCSDIGKATQLIVNCKGWTLDSTLNRHH